MTFSLDNICCTLLLRGAVNIILNIIGSDQYNIVDNCPRTSSPRNWFKPTTPIWQVSWFWTKSRQPFPCIDQPDYKELVPLPPEIGSSRPRPSDSCLGFEQKVDCHFRVLTNRISRNLYLTFPSMYYLSVDVESWICGSPGIARESQSSVSYSGHDGSWQTGMSCLKTFLFLMVGVYINFLSMPFDVSVLCYVLEKITCHFLSSVVHNSHTCSLDRIFHRSLCVSNSLAVVLSRMLFWLKSSSHCTSFVRNSSANR